MPGKRDVYDVLIASPSDVRDEVKILVDTIYRWNNINSDKYSVFLNPVNWRTHSFPEMGGEPQKIINNQIVDKADILIGVFWSRIGTPTKDAESGTVEEINKFITNGKPALLYFSSKTIDPYAMDNAQFSKVKEIKDKYKSEGLIWEFSEIVEFKELIISHLTSTVGKITSDRTKLKEDLSTEKNKLIKTDHSIESINSIGNILPHCFEIFQDLESAKAAMCTTGLGDLDYVIGKITPGSVYLFAGYHGVGKTSLLRTICVNLSVNRKVPCVVFSFDGDKIIFTIKLLCNAARIDPKLLFSGHLPKRDLPNLSFAAGPLSEAPITIIDDLTITAETLLQQIRSLSHNKIFFIDNLHMLKNFTGIESKTDYSEFFRSLKILANELKISFIIFTTIDKQSRIADDYISELNIYGNIARYSDVVGFLEKYKEEKDDNIHKLILKKNTFGMQDVIYLKYNSECLRFDDYVIDTGGW
jgi:replicative DNA helicase